MKIKISTALNIGQRDNNEDALIFCPDLSLQQWSHGLMDMYIPLGECGAIAVVADGMGGANAGEVASDIALRSVQEMFSAENAASAVASGQGSIKSLLEKAIRRADAAILERIATDDKTRGMGTTIVVCWMLNDNAYIAWCGDSRCYVFNPVTGLKQLTRDHSLVQEMVDNGEISEKEAFLHPDSNIITRGLGDFSNEGEPDIVIHGIKPNDTIILCSDGLCGYCENQDMKETIKHSFINVDECCNQLLQMALDAGGHDNISIVVASCIGNQQELPQKATFAQKLKRFIGM